MNPTEVEKIYLDMDGVLADFEKGVFDCTGIVPLPQNEKYDSEENKRKEDEMWEKLKDVSHFYDRLEVMPGAKEFFDELYEKYGDKCEILSGIPKAERGLVTSGEDKIAWIRRLFSEDIKVNVVCRREKKNYCKGPGCILIDDYDKTIREWNEGGGTGIAHKSVEETRQKLKELGIL